MAHCGGPQHSTLLWTVEEHHMPQQRLAQWPLERRISYGTVDFRRFRLRATAFHSSVWSRSDGEWVCVVHTESLAGDPLGRHLPTGGIQRRHMAGAARIGEAIAGLPNREHRRRPEAASAAGLSGVPRTKTAKIAAPPVRHQGPEYCCCCQNVSHRFAACRLTSRLLQAPSERAYHAPVPCRHRSDRSNGIDRRNAQRH